MYSSQRWWCLPDMNKLCPLCRVVRTNTCKSDNVMVIGRKTFAVGWRKQCGAPCGRPSNPSHANNDGHDYEMDVSDVSYFVFIRWSPTAGWTRSAKNMQHRQIIKIHYVMWKYVYLFQYIFCVRWNGEQMILVFDYFAYFISFI